MKHTLIALAALLVAVPTASARWQRPLPTSTWVGFPQIGGGRFDTDCGPKIRRYAVLYRSCPRSQWRTYGIYPTRTDARWVERSLQRQGFRAKIETIR